MKSWTTQAEQRLAEYLRERVSREGLPGEEAEDLKQDLLGHIHEEAERSSGENIGLMQLEGILGRLDAGCRPAPVSRSNSVRPARAFGVFLCWAFGVVLPAGVLLFESLVSFCGSVFFDPVPTWWHFLLISLVPAANAWLLVGTPGARERAKGVAAGGALVVSAFYGILFLPIIHFSIIALLFVGLGLLSLSPVLAAVCTWFISRGWGRRTADALSFRSGRRVGAGAACVLLVGLVTPALWTRLNLNATMEGGQRAEAAISRLRLFHSEPVLLKACYEGNRGTEMATDISGWILMGWRIPFASLDDGNLPVLKSDVSRQVFFRVTGKPFNSLKPPLSQRGRALLGRGDTFEDFEFDDHLGGDEVAVRLRDLDLSDSRFDGHFDSFSRIGYGEWTMVFQNSSQQQKEARCQIRLPHDGRVSRLTLWVDGEPREAAFSTVANVKAAYRSVAVVQRRDPVLVNMVGPDTVMMQCFPVPARGQMKIRLGVTAPLHDGRWELPRMVERNFGIKEGLEQSLWLQGDKGFSLTDGTKPHASHRDGEGESLPVSLAADAVQGRNLVVRMDALSDIPAVVWCEDRFAKTGEGILIREPITVHRSAAKELLVVIDGSVSLADSKGWITAALKQVPEVGLRIFLADDHSREISVGEIGNHRFSGGRDNEPALREAIRAAKETGAPIVWLHGPQVVGLSQPEALLQLLERGTVRPEIHEVEAVAGPNRLAESIFRTGCLIRGPWLDDPVSDFARFLNDLRSEREQPSWHWKRAASAGELEGKRVWDQLARSWAARAVEDHAVNMSDSDRAELAARYQLVTPCSGAVVLESREQYDQHGLTPVEGDAVPHVPNVPEPSVGILLIVSAAVAAMRRKRTA